MNLLLAVTDLMLYFHLKFLRRLNFFLLLSPQSSVSVSSLWLTNKRNKEKGREKKEKSLPRGLALLWYLQVCTDLWWCSGGDWQWWTTEPTAQCRPSTWLFEYWCLLLLQRLKAELSLRPALAALVHVIIVSNRAKTLSAKAGSIWFRGHKQTMTDARPRQI